eukprot:s1359_g14.t1
MVFVDGVSMSYEVNADGSRKRVQLSAQQVQVLEELNACCLDPQWHPCQSSVAQKQLLMTNNCQLVRRARHKWYRRPTDKCNMHDRHSGVGVEVPAVYVEVQGEHDAAESGEGIADASRAEARVSFGTLNMQVRNPEDSFEDLFRKCDILCLQEVTPSCVEDLLQAGRRHGYEVATAMGRGSVSTEPYDVCMLLRVATIRKLRLSLSPLTAESPRRLLVVQVQLRSNGAVLAVGTAHLTAGPECQMQRSAELKSALSTLAALPVDGHLLLGDLNMRKEEDLTTTEEVGHGTTHGIVPVGIHRTLAHFAQSILISRQMLASSGGASTESYFGRRTIGGSQRQKVKKRCALPP